MRLSIKDLYKQKGKDILIRDMNLEINAGEGISLHSDMAHIEALFSLLSKVDIPSNGTIEGDYIDGLHWIRLDDGIFDFMTVKQYLKFFTKLTLSQVSVNDTCLNMSLNDVSSRKIKLLSITQKIRVQLARVFLLSPKLILFEIPLNTEDYILDKLLQVSFEYLYQNGVSIIFHSQHMDNLKTMVYDIYKLNGDGFVKYAPEIVEHIVYIEQPQDVLPKINVYKIPCKAEGKVILFNPFEIDYIESIESTCHLHVLSKIYPSHLTISELETRLTPYGFFRCHRSYIVNLQSVQEVITYSKSSVVLAIKNNTDQVPLSRSKMDEFKKIMDI